MRKTDKISIQQIADLAGVSIATVSRVMNHKNTVKEDTRRKILEVMEKLNYNPSAVFVTKDTSNTILLCVSELRNPFNSLVISGIQRAAHQHNYRVFILQAKEVNFAFEDFKDVLQSHSFAGIILLTGVTDLRLLEMLAMSCPIVRCNEFCDVNGIPSVSINDFEAARKATEYLIFCGYKKIALLNCSLEFRFAQQRENGYSEALDKAGLEKNADWIAHVSSIDYNLAYSYAMNILNLPNRPDAFFTVSDVYAVAALHATKKLGLRVPEDISIIGFDNIEVSSMVDPAITTIEQPGVQIGYQGCELLIEKIRNPSVLRKQIVLDTELIVRKSTARNIETEDVAHKEIYSQIIR
jgi:DNA-binding LacI/PurR family transcriptional regulator